MADKKQAEVVVTPWPSSGKVNEQQIRRKMAEQNLAPYRWSNGPHDVYGAHAHPYDKVIYVVEGSITFGLPQVDMEIVLGAGDRLDLPKGTVHSAVVGPEGVVCLEAHR